MKYYIDTEFIEDGKTIDLVSIGIVAEDDRQLYRQNKDANFTKASDWVWRNVFPHLVHFDMSGKRSCRETQYYDGGQVLTGRCSKDCRWASYWEIRDLVREFCDPDKYGKPEFWGYYADYDWVAFCQLFGCMIHLPKGFPMYCRDIKQLSNALGVDRISIPQPKEHHALQDALWNKAAFEHLINSSASQTDPKNADPIRYMHVIPVGDFDIHAAQATCWCHPTQGADGFVTHNAKDCREAKERATGQKCSEGWILIAENR